MALLALDTFDHPTIPGYVLTGVVLGQVVLQQRFLELSQLGVLFLVFVFGMKLEPRRLRSVASKSFGAALTVVGVTAALSFIFANFIGLSATDSMYFSLAASLSSSLVGLELIEESLRIDLLHGRLAESIHLLQDAAAAAFIVAASALASQNPFVAALQGVGIFAGALLAREVLPELIATSSQTEHALFGTLAVLTSFLALSQLAGTPLIVGSFAAGLSLAKFPFNEEALEVVQPLEDFFSVIFFVSLGALIGVPSASTLALTGFLLLFTLLFKPLITAFELMESGLDSRTSYLTGLSLDQVSEFALVVVIQAFVSGTVTRPVFESVVIAASLSMVVSSYTNRHAEPIARAAERLGVSSTGRNRELSSVDSRLEDHIVIVGYGVRGSVTATRLYESGYEVVVIENDPEKLTEASSRLENYVMGDAREEESWERARADQASAVVSTVEDKVVSARALNYSEGARVFLNAATPGEAADLLDREADLVDYPGVLESTVVLDHFESARADRNYSEQLRRRKMLELRKETSPYEE